MRDAYDFGDTNIKRNKTKYERMTTLWILVMYTRIWGSNHRFRRIAMSSVSLIRVVIPRLLNIPSILQLRYIQQDDISRNLLAIRSRIYIPYMSIFLFLIHSLSV